MKSSLNAIAEAVVTRVDESSATKAELARGEAKVDAERETKSDRLDRIEDRLDKMDARMDRMEDRLDKMDDKLNKLDNRVTRLETKFNIQMGLLIAILLLLVRDVIINS